LQRPSFLLADEGRYARIIIPASEVRILPSPQYLLCAVKANAFLVARWMYFSEIKSRAEPLGNDIGEGTSPVIKMIVLALLPVP
jgi:hypothetical protein